MNVDLAFEVAEVSFDQFERRKTPRRVVSLLDLQSKAFFASIANMQIDFDLGIEVNEVPFDQFERRKRPRDVL
jgi:hypothetical protein